MKNVTIALDDEIHRQARIRAAELGTSLSALVKDYLTGLVSGQQQEFQGVRDMQVPFKHAEPVASGPPWLVGGQWVYTRDGKPRQPGALRHLPDLPGDFDDWDAAMEAAFADVFKPWNDDDFDPLP
jgi:hypothetical protein